MGKAECREELVAGNDARWKKRHAEENNSPDKYDMPDLKSTPSQTMHRAKLFAGKNDSRVERDAKSEAYQIKRYAGSRDDLGKWFIMGRMELSVGHLFQITNQLLQGHY